MEEKKKVKEYKVKFVKSDGVISCIAKEANYYATNKRPRPLKGELITYEDKPYKRFTILKKLGKWLGKI